MVSQHTLQVSGGGVYPSMPCRFPGPSPGRGLRGLAGGGGSPGPHPVGGGFQAHTRGGVSQHALRQTPPTHTTDGYCCGWYASYLNAFLSLLLRSPFLDGLEKFVHF